MRSRIHLNKLVDEYVNLAYHGMRAREREWVVELERHYAADVGDVDLYPQELGRVLIKRR